MILKSRGNFHHKDTKAPRDRSHQTFVSSCLGGEASCRIVSFDSISPSQSEVLLCGQRGLPIMGAMYGVPEVNKAVSARTVRKKSVSDWTAWQNSLEPVRFSQKGVALCDTIRLMKPVKLLKLMEALEIDSDEHEARVDLQNGTLVHLPHSLLRAVEEEDEEVLKGLADWEREDLEVAREVIADSGGRFVPAPSKFDFHEYRQMERFIGTVDDDAAAEELWRAIKGKGAFRYFKDTARRLGLLDRWYAYRDSAMKQFVIDWAEAREISFDDDVPPRPAA